MTVEAKKINEFQVNDTIIGFYLIKQADIKTGSTGKKYMDIILADKTGEINAKLWEVKDGLQDTVKPQSLVKIKALVTSWQGTNQLKIDLIRPVEERDEVKIEDFVPSAPYEGNDMYEEILLYIDSMESEQIKALVKKVFEGYKDRLMYYPAAKKNHHAIRTGLLYHILSMLRLGEKIVDLYSFLNRDLVYGGIILHDLAKMEEMDSSELGIVNDYTVEGTLLGHITMGIKNLELLAIELNTDREVVMLLQHMILSHHYEPEFGSPVKPLIPEAEILHYIDMIDARMFDMRKVLEEIEPGQFSERLWSLENRRLYKRKEV